VDTLRHQAHGVGVRGFIRQTIKSSMPPRRRVRRHIEQLPSGSYSAVVHGGTDLLTGTHRQIREVAKTYDVGGIVDGPLDARQASVGREADLPGRTG
jgi:hypothetical protein